MADRDSIRWLHLSDFHVGKDDYAQRTMFSYITRLVASAKANGFTPDLVFVTGDLANKGRPEEHEEFWLEFLVDLHNVIGGDIEERTFVVPGNHDVDREQNQGFSRDELSSATSRYFDPTEEGLRLRSLLLPRFQSFIDSDLSVARGDLQLPKGAFTVIVEVRGHVVGITGINTAWLSKDDHDERTLTPGKPLLEGVLTNLADVHLHVVLGHHPLDWLIPAQQRPIKSLLGQHAAVYLHGHLHDTWAEPTYGGGHQFLAVQAGAAFQAREGEPWRNGVVFGEVQIAAQELWLQPWTWIPEHQDWALAAEAYPEVRRQGDWWVYALPGSDEARRVAQSAQQAVPPPAGWEVRSAGTLARHTQPLDERSAVAFFDGAVPGWPMALSTSIPVRRVVESVSSVFEGEAPSTAHLAVLVAPACEGKTTALLQAAWAIAHDKPDWHILRRIDDGVPLPSPETILRILDGEGTWVVVIDEADGVSRDLYSLIRDLSDDQRRGVHFLIACGDSAWVSSGAAALPWSDICVFRQFRWEGLELPDAKAIVGAWSAFGEDGLGDLASAPDRDRVDKLMEYAQREGTASDGAFFGALLTARHGNDLRDHVRLLLNRLGTRTVGRSTVTLRTVFAFIAAMHAEHLLFLSRPVLAEAIGWDLDRLHQDVLAPLGREAAATTTSSFILTRHTQIASEVVSVLEQDFQEDVGRLFVTLASSAIDASRSGPYVPELAAWRYELPEHFAKTGRVPSLWLSPMRCLQPNPTTR